MDSNQVVSDGGILIRRSVMNKVVSDGLTLIKWSVMGGQ